jgi:hypothetical protein
MMRTLHRLGRTLFIGVVTIGFGSVTFAQQAEKVCFLTVAKSSHSGHPERKNYVINSKAEWEVLWAQVVSGTNPIPDLPEIDFARRTIIGVFQGSEPNPGFEITISEITKREDRVIVSVKELLNLNCPAPGVVAKSFHFVEVDKLDPAQVEFSIKKKVRKCS